MSTPQKAKGSAASLPAAAAVVKTKALTRKADEPSDSEMSDDNDEPVQREKLPARKAAIKAQARIIQELAQWAAAEKGKQT
jgi:hypothetical protein